ncbi:MAG: DUF4350 domain-containing protein [Candidatus Solibacter usitatus]|nr:DUF4350 domain-containing protein [Candidatus Solibacter usitatus]
MTEFQTLVRFQRLGLGMAVAGVVWLMWPGPLGDPKFDARVFQPASKVSPKPVVLIDEAHSNLDTAWGRYRPFADLLRNDGYTIAVNRRKFTWQALEGARVLVVADALSTTQKMLASLGQERKFRWRADAFDEPETRAVREWVRGGGSLLLIAGRAPYGEAAQGLAAQFAVEMSGGRVEDLVHHDPQTGKPDFLLFSRSNGLLGEHAITLGRGEDEQLSQVLSFGGQALRGPPGSAAFLKLSEHAIVSPSAWTPAGQGLALEFGAGRVVVLAEDAMLTSLVERTGNKELHLGMSRPGYDNRQLTLNVIHWLTRIL